MHAASYKAVKQKFRTDEILLRDDMLKFENTIPGIRVSYYAPSDRIFDRIDSIKQSIY